MSIKIPLYFLASPSPKGLISIRLIAWVTFNSPESNPKPLRAIIDTGAPVSLIPFKVWGKSFVTMGNSAIIHSVSDRPECDIEVTQGQITMSLLNDKGEIMITNITIEADLCHTSEMPIILGWHNFLNQARIVIDYPTGEAWLEWQEMRLLKQ